MISNQKIGTATKPSDVEYPIAYRVVSWVRILVIVGGLGFGAAWTYITIFPAYAQGKAVFAPILACFDLLLLAGLAYGIAWALTGKITLYADRFEQQKPFLRRMLHLDDIAGRRYTTGRGAGYPVIVLKSGAAFSIDSTSYGLDERFNRWFMRLPDVNEIERAKELERIRTDTSLGASPNERMAANSSRRQNFAVQGSLLTMVAFAMFFASMSSMGHLSALFAVNALLPWAVCLLLVIYRDQASGPDSGKFAFVVAAILLPVMSLGVLAADNARVAEPGPVILWGVAIGLFLLVLALILAIRAKARPVPGRILVMALIFLPYTSVYGGGVLALANRTLDNVAPQVVPAKVISKYVQRGKSSTHYYVRIASAGMLEDRLSIRVLNDEYARTTQGDDICIAIHPGRFGFRWTETINCPGEVRRP